MKKISLVFTVLLVYGYADIALEPMIVTAQNFEQKLDTVTDNAQVITSSMIEAHHMLNLGDILARLGNIQMTQNGGLGQSQSVRLRGFDSKRVLVLIDGVRINDITGLNGASFEHILASDIERIEIIKGAQSGVWGADASAGVINIITKQAKKGFHTFLSAGYGSYNTTQGALAMSYKSEKFDVKLSAQAIGSDGFSAAEPKAGTANFGTKGDALGYDKDGYENQTYDISLGHHLTSHDRISVQMKKIRAYTEYDAKEGVDAKNVDDPFGFGSSDYFVNTNQSFFQTMYTHKGEIHDIKAMAAKSEFERDQFGGYKGSLLEYGLKDRIAYSNNSILHIGWDYQAVAQTLSAGTNLNKNFISDAFYVSNVNQWAQWVFSQSVRYDIYDVFDDKLTGKLGLKYLYGDASIGVNIGTGYNVPTLYQLFDGWSGNDALKPEETTSIDIKASHKGVSIAYFYNEIYNLIDYDMGTFKFQNIAGVSTLQGVELRFEKQLNDNTNLNVDYAYLDARDAQQKTLARRANHAAHMHITSTLNRTLSLITTFEYVGTRYDGLDRSGAQTGEYLLVHLTANYDIKPYKVFLKVDNVFDTFYQVADGYQTPGINFRSGLSAQF